MSARLRPVYVFDEENEFYQRHASGVKREFLNESREIEAFNKRGTQFKCWIVAKLDEARGNSYWLFFIRPSASADHLFPREGETCDVTLWSKNGKSRRWEKFWVAERIENPAATFNIPDGPAHRLPAFKVRVPSSVPQDILVAMEDDPEEVGFDAPSRLQRKWAFGDKKAFMVTMELRISSATMNAELGALDRLHHDPNAQDPLTAKQKAAYKYLLAFKETPFIVNMFDHFPHLRDPMNNPNMPPKVIAMLSGFNAQQRTAYKDVLSKIPSGVCILPGCPGAGKTHWNLVLTAAIQSKKVIWHGPNSSSNRSAKVLYILDINKSLDDTANKMVKLYKVLGLKRYAVRLHGWHYGDDKEDDKKDDKKGDKKESGIQNDVKIDFSKRFLLLSRMNRYRRQTMSEGCMAPSLEELALTTYEEHQSTHYRELHDAMRGGRSERLRELVAKLYTDVLDQVSIIFTTPVPAATGFHGLFKPDLVIFDESPHAREASTMISVAHYNPIAWIFSGDHRQTRPFIASDDVRDNPWAPQMLVSMMERADRADAIRHSLLINHRAYGGLQELASEMFYGKKMITGHKQSDLFPPSVRHIQRYLERFLPPGQKCKEPRLIAFNSKRGEVQVGTTWYNPTHIAWVMERVMELLQDPMFRQVGKNERGTVLIISPYKESYHRYKRAIKDLPEQWQMRLNVEARCEARTIDTCQGGESDMVFLDMVRSESTDFTDDPNRLTVAITRARQGEIIMMHPGMMRSARFLKGIFNYCASKGQVVDISTHGQPQELTQVPTEQRDYAEHVRYQAQFDEERLAHGLEPVAVDAQAGMHVPTAAADEVDKPEIDDGPPSIFAEKFAQMGLFDYMESILKENKADRDVKVSRAQARAQIQTNAFGQPESAAAQVMPQVGDQTSVQGLAQTTGNAPRPPPAVVDLGTNNTGIFDMADSMPKGRSLHKKAPISNVDLLARAMTGSTDPAPRQAPAQTSGTGQAFTAPLDQGLGQSRWNTSPAETPSGQQVNAAATMSNGVYGGHRDAPSSPATNGFRTGTSQGPYAAQHDPVTVHPSLDLGRAALGDAGAGAGAGATVQPPPGLNGDTRNGVAEMKKDSEPLPSGSGWW